MENGCRDPVASRIETIASLFLGRLDSYGSFERVPKGFWAARAAIQQAEPHSTPRIFWENGGFLAWFALLILRNDANGTKHFTHKVECRQMLPELENEPTDSRKAVAQQILSRASTDMQMKISRLLNRLQDSSEQPSPASTNKRQREIPRAGSPFSITHSCSTGVTAAPAETDPPSSLNTPSSETEAALPARDVACPADHYTPEHHILREDHVLAPASLDAAIRLFPQDFADAIVRHRDHNTFAAGISMRFSKADTRGCHMTVEITYEKAPRLVQDLFGVDLETRGRLRYASLASGTTIVPNPGITFNHCHLEAIEPLFGAEVTRAIHDSPEYTHEKEQRRRKPGAYPSTSQAAQLTR
ncbi:hypothetical protein F4808DRAFT_401995 [Astrocystis sublimbata]|nr:hypothetical protein F4808DRAFT_401995 [Astrocystis sublimbata]